MLFQSEQMAACLLNLINAALHRNLHWSQIRVKGEHWEGVSVLPWIPSDIMRVLSADVCAQLVLKHVETAPQR